jgi:hypothetical protein
MSEKLITACMGLVALAAFALPAVASASPQITHPTGTRLATEKKFLGTLGVSKFTDANGGALFECTSGAMTGTLTKNNGTEIEGNIESAAIAGTASEGGCTGFVIGPARVTTAVGNGVPWCLRANSAMNTDEFQIRGGKCSEASRAITLVFDMGIGVNCAYERTVAIKGSFTTDTTGDAILTTTGVGVTGEEDTGFTREGTNVFCPMSGRFPFEFTLETDSGTAEPLYLS